MQRRNEASRQGIVVTRVTRAEDHGFYWLTTVEGQLRGKYVRGSCRFYPAQNRADLKL